MCLLNWMIFQSYSSLTGMQNTRKTSLKVATTTSSTFLAENGNAF